MKLTTTGLLLVGGLFCATAHAETSVFAEYRFGRFDPQGVDKTIGSPSAGFLTSLDGEGRHSVGLAYSRYSWNDSSSWASVDGKTGQNIQTSTHWDALYLVYQYKQPIATHLHLYARAKVGAGKAHTSGTATQYGGFTGPLSYSISGSNKTGLAAEADLGLGWELTSHWLLRAGLGYSRLENKADSSSWSYTDLKGPQAHAGISYTF